MLLLLRKIRKQLIKKGSFQSYLIYALGEIVLVVVGILIAIQLEDLRQDYDNRKKERQILDQLNADFIRNQQEFERIRWNHQQVSHAAGWLLNEIPFSSSRYQDSVQHYLRLTLQTWTYDPSTTSIDALTNTASFNLIRNDTLRNLITAWKDIIEDINEEEYYARDVFRDRYLNYYMDRIKVQDLFTPETPDFELLDEIKCSNVILERKITTDFALVEMNALEPVLDEILRLTETR